MCRSTVFSSEEAPPTRAMSSRALRHVGTTCRRWGEKYNQGKNLTLCTVGSAVRWTTTPSSPTTTQHEPLDPALLGVAVVPYSQLWEAIAGL